MSSQGSWWVRFLEKYRVPLMAVMLPISFIYGIWKATQRAILRKLKKTPATHEGRVQLISEVLKAREALPPEQRQKIVTDRPSAEALTIGFLDKSDMCRVPTGSLRNVLKLDEERQTILLEPFVSVQEAADFLIPRGYMLASHLEYGRATVGGLAMAVGMTTHAHVTGLLQETVVAYEVVLGDGEVVRVTEDGPHSDLFQALPWSHGTLGILVALEMKVIPIKKYVRLKYIPVKGLQNIADEIREQCGALDPSAKLPTFCEATLFGMNDGVVTVGEFDDGEDPRGAKVNRLALWFKPWWYKHVQGYSKRGEVGEELVPVWDYTLRHTRAIFWVMELMTPFGNHWLFRYLFGWLLPLDSTFMKLTTTSGVRELQVQKQIFQDLTFPMTDLERSIKLSTECFDLWPLLVYPCKEFVHGKGQGQLRPPKPHQLCPGADPKWGMYFDLGIYGVPGYVLRKEPYNPTRAMRRFVELMLEVGGAPFLYADHWFSEEEFEQLFDLTSWRKCRKKYGAEGNFPTIWQKVRPEVDTIKMGDVDLYAVEEAKVDLPEREKVKN